MIKKLSVIFSCLFVLALITSPAVAQIGYSKDINPTSQPGTDFDDEVSVAAGTQITIDVQVNDLPLAPITAGVAILYDPNLITVISSAIYDGAEISREDGGTNWDPGFSGTVDAGPLDPPNEGSSLYLITCGNFATVPPVNGDIPVARFVLEYQGPGETTVEFRTVPGFDTVVGDTTVFDGDIVPNIITINKGNGTNTTTTGSGTTTTPTSTTSPSTTTSAGTSTTTTEPSSSSWQTAYAMMWGEDKEQKLSLLRYFRDEAVARDKLVRNYVSLLYRNSSEVAGVFIKYPLLCLETRKLVEALLPSIESFFETEKLVLTASQKDRVESFLNQFESKVTPELKGIIQDFRKDLRDGRLFLTIS